MDWLDAHAGGVQAIATLVLVALTAYYAWASRALVRETRAALGSAARATLQARMDKISELMIQHPDLFTRLDAPEATGSEDDARFHVANMFLSMLEEAHTQYSLERSMTADDWSAWEATADRFIQRRYIVGYWQNVRVTFEPSFRRFIDARLMQAGADPVVGQVPASEL